MSMIKRTMAAALAVSAAAAAVSCSGKKPAPSSSEALPEIPELTEPVEELPRRTEISGQTITWLADYDLNPSGDEERSAALSMFEDYYGASVVFAYTKPEDRFDTLAGMINGGEEVDMFPFDNGAFPDGVVRQQFEPLDPYFDTLGVDEGLWDDMTAVIEKFAYNGEHYVMPYSVSSPQLIIYSRKLMEENGFDDPYKLYEENKWDWDAMLEMMWKFVAAAETGKTRYGINGTFGQALLQSTGDTIVQSSGTGFANNAASQKLEKAGQLMEVLVAEKLYDTSWKAYFPSNKQTLFYAMGDWALGKSNAENPDLDIMAVPFPKSPEADKQFVSCTYDAKMLVKDSNKGDAVAAYIKCERIAASRPEYTAPAKEQATAKNGGTTPFITEEQYDALCEYLDACRVDPIYELAQGMGGKMYGSGSYTYDTTGAANNLADALLEGRSPEKTWKELRDRWSKVIDEELKRFK